MNYLQQNPSIIRPAAAILNIIQEKFAHKATASFSTELLKGFLWIDDDGVAKLLNGRLRISPEIAEKLSNFFDGTSKEYWLQKQKKYVTSTIRSAFVDYLDAELLKARNRIDELTLLSCGPCSNYSVELSHKIRLAEAITVIKFHILQFDNASQLESMIEARMTAIDAF